MRFRGAIFDLDGTLLDSMGMWDDIDVAFLSRRGLTVPDDYVQAIVPLSFRETAVYTIDRFGLTETYLLCRPLRRKEAGSQPPQCAQRG